jgi:hypothetical protein
MVIIIQAMVIKKLALVIKTQDLVSYLVTKTQVMVIS